MSLCFQFKVGDGPLTVLLLYTCLVLNFLRHQEMNTKYPTVDSNPPLDYSGLHLILGHFTIICSRMLGKSFDRPFCLGFYFFQYHLSYSLWHLISSNELEVLLNLISNHYLYELHFSSNCLRLSRLYLAYTSCGVYSSICNFFIIITLVQTF